jgi:hypothetical protein
MLGPDQVLTSLGSLYCNSWGILAFLPEFSSLCSSSSSFSKMSRPRSYRGGFFLTRIEAVGSIYPIEDDHNDEEDLLAARRAVTFC